MKIGICIYIILILFIPLTCFEHRLLYSESYCCRQMSRDLEDALEFIGIDVQLVCGYNQDGNGHLWLSIYGVEFDSVWLLPLPNREDYPMWQEIFEDYSELEVLNE